MTTQSTAKPSVSDELAGPTPHQIGVPRWAITIVLGSIIAGLILWLWRGGCTNKHAGTANTPRSTETTEPAEIGKPLASERDELEHLSELPDPTPDQWERRINLRVKIDAYEAEEARKLAAIRRLKMEEGHDPRVLHIQNQRHIDQLLSWGWESLVEGKPDSAVTFYQAVIDKHPNSPEANRAADMIRQIKGEKEGDQP
jgi:hypothetical protein